MIIEMHAHTAEHSTCSSVSAITLVTRALHKEMQGIVLTDHHYLWSAAEIEALRKAAGLPDHFLVLPGQEIRTADFGDVLVYGADRCFPRNTPLGEIRRLCPEAALVWAHPYRHEHLPLAGQLLDQRLDAIEIFNANHSVAENIRGLRDWHRYKFNATGGTDTHAPSYAGTYPTIFDHPFHTVQEMAEEIRHGRCRPFFKEIPRTGSQNRVTELTIGTKGFDDQREKIIVKTHTDERKWTSAERAYHIVEDLAHQGFSGGRYRVPRPLGRDNENHTLIEEGVRGKLLFDKLLKADVTSARYDLRLAGRWLARLHSCRLCITPADEYLPAEAQRLDRYLNHFSESKHPQTRRVRELTEQIRQLLVSMCGVEQSHFVQGHGDFHLKNILIGEDHPDDRTTTFVAAIDFDSSMCMPAAFDVGTFLAQYHNQLLHHPEIRAKAPVEIFLEAYLANYSPREENFLAQIELFKARSDLSIATDLLTVGLGESEDLFRVLVDAEKCLTNIVMHHTGRQGTEEK
jgi:aminoglycoside phosphotransferase (APT) family kinase protein